MLKSRSARPPPGWIYQQPETGFELSARTFNQLVSLVISHRLGNGIKPADRQSVETDIENYICGLLRGTKALWQFCHTRFDLPAPPLRMLPIGQNLFTPATLTYPPNKPNVVAASQPSTQSANRVTRRKTCATCG